MRLGIAALKSAVGAILSAGEAIVCTTDGFQFNDISKFVDLAKRLPPAIRDRATVIPEFADLDDAERAEMVAFVEADFELPENADVEQAVEVAMGVLFSLSDLVKLFVPKPE